MHYTLHGGADPDGCLQTLLLRMSLQLWSAALDLAEAHKTGEHGTMVGRMPASRQWLPGAKRDTGSGAPVYSLDVPYTSMMEHSFQWLGLKLEARIAQPLHSDHSDCACGGEHPALEVSCRL